MRPTSTKQLVGLDQIARAIIVGAMTSQMFHATANRDWRCENAESLSDATGAIPQ
jgi:hypothetical protein